jgi:hypothetical protein
MHCHCIDQSAAPRTAQLVRELEYASEDGHEQRRRLEFAVSSNRESRLHHTC